MKIKFWGTRGSLPKPMNNDSVLHVTEALVRDAVQKGRKTLDQFLSDLQILKKSKEPVVFGGHTTCTEIKTEKNSFIVDLGSGLIDYGYEALKSNQKDFQFLLTHMHWDHIMGLPFFVPLYVPRNKITIYHVHKNTPQAVQILFNGSNFPVKWEDISANVVFKPIKLYQKFEIAPGVIVSPFSLDHPGGSFGYRFEHKGIKIAIGVDGEYKRISREDLGKDLSYYQNLDALVFDAQYEIDELASRYDWGHCSPPIGVELALREGIRNMILSHHDPRANEDRLKKMHQDAVEHRNQNLIKHKKMWDKLNQNEGPTIISAFDGLELDFSK